MPPPSPPPHWTLLSLVFCTLDARTLASASCVSRTWHQIACQNELWKVLCLSKWPSLQSEPGRLLLTHAGSFRRFYALRCQAHLHCKNARSAGPARPRVEMKDLVFLLDVTHQGEPVCSVIRSGDVLSPAFAGRDIIHDFCFVFSTDATCDLSPEVSCLRSCGFGRGWSKEEVREFEVSWAIMVRGSQKIFEVLQTSKPGHVVANTCTFSEPLPKHICCAPITDNDAEVRMDFECLRHPTTSASGCTYTYSDFKLRHVVFSIVNTTSSRYLSQAQALGYLEHALLHDCQPILGLATMCPSLSKQRGF